MFFRRGCRVGRYLIKFWLNLVGNGRVNLSVPGECVYFSYRVRGLILSQLVGGNLMARELAGVDREITKR